MQDCLFWVVVVILLSGLTLSRTKQHWIGFVGMGIMTGRAISFGPDWPMATLNGGNTLIHLFMLIKLKWFPPVWSGRG